MLYCALVWLLPAHAPPNIRWFIPELPSWLGTAHSTTVPAGVSKVVDTDGRVLPKHGSLLVEETLGLARDDPVEAEPVTQMFAGEGEVFALHE